jgi:predicted nucleotidyltransferase
MSDQMTRTRACPSADDVLATLRACEADLRAAGVTRLSLFGSVARGDAEPGSDVDLAVEFDPAARVSLLGLVGLRQRIEDILGYKVDLVAEPVDSARLRANIERDRKLAFAA